MEHTENKRVTDGWRVESIRLTVFLARPTPLEPHQFEEFFQFPPDKGPLDGKNFIGIQSADKGQISFRLEVQPGRMDYKIESLMIPGDGFALIPQEIDLRETFLANALRMTPNFAGCKRLAMGMRFILPQDSRQQAYEKVGTLLKNAQTDAANTSDFFYRINRPCYLDLPDHSLRLKINRLGSWGAIQCRSAEFVGGVMTKNTKIGDAVLVETDVNTDFERDLEGLTAQNLAYILNELYSLSWAIAKKGEHDH